MCLFAAIVYAIAWTLLDRRDALWRSGRIAVREDPVQGEEQTGFPVTGQQGAVEAIRCHWRLR
jgi:hypothetical protein